jgi:hypothetical protein
MDIKAKRISDPLEGRVDSYLEVHHQDNGDVFLEVSGQDEKGKALVVRTQFLSRAGGGYHPHTIHALYELILAIQIDNQDPSNPERYK